jgi:hypothetical protein
MGINFWPDATGDSRVPTGMEDNESGPQKRPRLYCIARSDWMDI